MHPTGQFTVDNVTIWYDSQAFDVFEANLFDPDWLMAQGILTGAATGRSEAHFLHFAGRDMVLRHYRRGGLLGRVNPDCYVRTPAAKGRAAQEFQLLSWMRGQGLNVPRPIAARQVTKGLCYRADIIMERIPKARTLADHILESGLPETVWHDVGRSIGRMHKLGVHHSDLNCRNILLDESHTVWLVDFDKCERRVAGDWAQQNLARLRRSLQKLQRQHNATNWGVEDWRALIGGYYKDIESGQGLL